jgi:hypothetical protein
MEVTIEVMDLVGFYYNLSVPSVTSFNNLAIRMILKELAMFVAWNVLPRSSLCMKHLRNFGSEPISCKKRRVEEIFSTIFQQLKFWRLSNGTNILAGKSGV